MLAADLVAGGALQALLHTVSHDVRVQLATCILLRPARPIGIIAVMAAYSGACVSTMAVGALEAFASQKILSSQLDRMVSRGCFL
jgi:hypothetical protein